MRRFFRDMNPLVRGLGIVALIAAAIVLLSLEQTVISLHILARIAFILAIALFVFLVWREQRSEIGTWSARAKTVFYGAALLIVADFGVLFLQGLDGPDGLAFIVVLGCSGYAMWRVWRDQHTFA
ncbi:MAG: hypothetical protein ABR521_04980 [Gaiellaceae bacterium]